MPSGAVLVLYTGGTIGMVHAAAGNPASPLVAIQDEHQLTGSVPELQQLKLEVPYDLMPLRDSDGVQIRAVDSADISLAHWTAMAKQIEAHYDDYDGFVVLHGTDTMAYTASALSFMLCGLSKPVILTGSQIPISRYDTDAVWNFVRAVQVAGYRYTDQPLVPEVAVCFANRLFRGNRVRKMSTTALQGFGSPNYPALGQIGRFIRIYRERLVAPPDPSERPFLAQTSFDRRVLDFALFPGLNAQALQRILEMDDVQGMVLRTFGAGNAPNDENRADMNSPGLIEVLAEAVRNDKVIVNVTQCPEGQVEAGLYAASSPLLESGVISGLDMTPEAALTKLMWLLGTETDRDEVRSRMQVNQRGEQSESIVEARYRPSSGAAPLRGPLTVTAHPAGRVVPANLTRAVLRVTGLRVDGGADQRVGVFLNHADPEGLRDPELAGVVTVDSPQCVVTAAARRVVEEDHAIDVTLLADDGGAVTFDGMALAMFMRS